MIDITPHFILTAAVAFRVIPHFPPGFPQGQPYDPAENPDFPPAETGGGNDPVEFSVLGFVDIKPNYEKRPHPADGAFRKNAVRIYGLNSLYSSLFVPQTGQI